MAHALHFDSCVAQMMDNAELLAFKTQIRHVMMVRCF
jgi:hypothetical protein